MVASYREQMGMIFEGNGWHASLRDLLRSVTAEQAVWRSDDGGHTIYEILCHLTYSATEVTSRLRGGKPQWDEVASWVESPTTYTDAEWMVAIAQYEEARSALADAMESLEAAGESADNKKVHDMMQQVIHHEAFHAGQIALLRRLQQQAALM